MTMFSWTTKTAKLTAPDRLTLALAAALALTGCGGSGNATAGTNHHGRAGQPGTASHAAGKGP